MKKSVKDINKKLLATNKIAKITKAMQIMATMKAKKAIAKLDHFFLCQTVVETIFQTLQILIAQEEKKLSASPRKKKQLWLVFTSDLGFCSFFNNKVFASFFSQVNQEDLVIAIGQKGIQKLAANKINLLKKIPSHRFLNFGLEEVITYLLANLSKVSHLTVIYTQFQTNFKTKVITKLLLPPSLALSSLEKKRALLFLTEGSPMAIYHNTLSLYLKSLLYFYYLNSSASEERARQFAMDNASQNAQEMIEDLKLKYNQLRQEKITREILDLSQHTG